MRAYDCALTESVPPAVDAPVLSIVVPTYHRPAEVAHAVRSIARQVKGRLAGKVEILVTDNASGPETLEALRALKQTYPCVGYMIHETDQGGAFQVYAAAFRARGRWMWVFGDDDALADGGLAHVLQLLEREEPAFLTLNRQVWDKDFARLLTPAKNSLANTRFATFMDLLVAMGFDQLSFLTSQVYETAIARQVDPDFYVDSLSMYGQLGYYLEAFHDKPAYYSKAAHVQHRWDGALSERHVQNARHLATLLPLVVGYAGDRAGLREGFFEDINGRRSIGGPESRRVTFVDNILENLWRCSGMGTEIPDGEWDLLHRVASRWRPQRIAELQTAHTAAVELSTATRQFERLADDLRQRTSSPDPMTPEQFQAAQQLKADVLALKDSILKARDAAIQISKSFN